MAESRLRGVRFCRGWEAYNAGEIAGFTPDLARKLVDAGVAVAVETAVRQPLPSELPAPVQPDVAVPVKPRRPKGK